MTTAYHIPVLLQPTIDALCIQPNGVYVDCTLGGAGHSKAILEKLDNNGKLIVFDQDKDALANLPHDDRIIAIHQNFMHITKMLRLHHITQVHGILADLGISSHQIDEPSRGFAIRYNAPLDMRMDNRTTTTAAHILATYTEQALHKMLEQYGEVTNAKTLAHNIATVRQSMPIATTDDLKHILEPYAKGNPNKYYAQVFQALRIAVNEELQALKVLLAQVPALLYPQGRVAIITFHSLEDRIVKNYFKKGIYSEAEAAIDYNPFDNTPKTYPLRPTTKKPIEATPEEIKENPRSRSAKLRVAIKN